MPPRPPRLSRLLHVAITFALVNEFSINVQARDNIKRRPKEKSIGVQKNICDITDRNSKVHCYCENTREPRNATKAECWVFNGGIPHDDLIWQSFASQPTLQTLSFNVRVDGALNYVPTEALQYLPKLSSINIKYADISEIMSYAFANLTNLKEAALAQNQIVMLQPYAFAHLPNVTIINFEENLIAEIGTESFFDMPKLEKLVFTKNNISSIRDGAFQHTFNLLELDLNKNNIFHLNRHTFDGLANLRKLDLRKNHIYNLTEFTFAELWNLQELLLGKNNLKFISERAFDGLSQLRKLSLDDNRLVALPPRLFEGVRGLSSLDLRSNELHALSLDNIKPILDNLKPQNSSLLLEDNDFVCDCQLKWMFIFKNETKSEKTKSSLLNVTCKFDPVIVSSAYNKMPEGGKEYNQEVIHSSMTVETVDEKNNSNKMVGSQAIKANQFEIVLKKEKKNVLKLEPESLPCHVEVTTTTTAVPAPVVDVVKPVKSDIKSFFSLLTNSTPKIRISDLLLSCVICVFVFT